MPLSILIYYYSWYPKVDGVTIRYDGIINHLLACGHRVVLCVPHRPITEPRTQSRFQAHPAFQLVILPSLKLSTLVYNDSLVYHADPRQFGGPIRKTLETIVCTNQIDLIHVALPDPINPLLILLSTIHHIPIIGIYHTDVGNYVKNLPVSYHAFRLAQKWFMMYDSLSCFSTTSETMRKALLTQKVINETSDIYVLPPCVDTDKFKWIMPTKQWRWSVGTIRLLYVGRVEQEKSIERILYAMDESMSLVVIGEGTQLPVLTKLSQQLGLDVHFIGALSQEQLVDWYCSTDFFIMPSETETLGFTTIESMMCGGCVLGFSAGGTLDIIQHEVNGMLWSTIEELRYLIKTTYQRIDYMHKICHNAQIRRNQYSIEDSVDDLLLTYTRLIEAPPVYCIYTAAYCHIVMMCWYLTGFGIVWLELFIDAIQRPTSIWRTCCLLGILGFSRMVVS
jgi:glycosyltransferase involved in cell wall biosynthesis